MRPEEKLTMIKGVGDKTTALFSKLHIENAGQLAAFYPRDYESFGDTIKIAELKSGELAAVKATVTKAPVTKKMKALQITTVSCSDGTGELRLTFFRMPYLNKILQKGTTHIFRGTVQGKTALFMEQPKIYKEEEYLKLRSVLQPRYPLTAGLTNKTVQKCVSAVLEELIFPEFLPEIILKEYDLMGREEAMHQIHFPSDLDALKNARRRLVFDEFLIFLLQLKYMKEHNQVLTVEEPFLAVADTGRFIESLPYELTNAQKRVWSEIENDLQKKAAMNRLIQGDVGSGKTILAFLALLMCAANGKQGCLMAPTEVLAKQHFDALTEYTDKYHLCTRPILLTGSMTAKEKRDAYERIAMGMANVIIGTHALIQEAVAYKNLALVITDEQHRFGVRQRETLAGKGDNVHVLVMSATPIPRTLAIVLYGDLHVSVLDEMPANRLPIKNAVVDINWRPKAYQFIAREVAEGRQVYVICPMVEEGELEGCENVLDYTEKLRQELPASIQISYLHGKMKPAEKNRIMESFAAHNIDVLVSTTVIEVGINVPNATVMMVENAERFGLAQLHQLRGRVGRGKHQSYCIFVSGNDNKRTMERLEILKRSNDGFFIANEDLRLRGPGDLFGIRQSGLMEFSLGDIYQDSDLLLKTAQLADRILEDSKAGEEALWLLIFEYLASAGENSIDFRTI